MLLGIFVSRCGLFLPLFPIPSVFFQGLAYVVEMVGFPQQHSVDRFRALVLEFEKLP